MTRSILRYVTDKDYRFLVNSRRYVYKSMSDEEYLKRLYRIKLGTELDLEHPRTFNEKLQWLKLHDRNPMYTVMVDKYAVKKWVADRIGEEYVIPLLGVWDHFDEIDFDALPDQFVLKCTHDSGGLVIVKDKSKLDRAAAKRKIEKCLKHNYYWIGREWPYKNVPPRIIAEAYMEDEQTSELRDYKIFTFNGVAKALFIATDRQKKGEDTKFDFFDIDFKHLPFTNGHPNANTTPAKPETFELMVALAEKLSRNIPHLRADFYEVNGKAYFGELTFSHWSGMVPFEPEEWDKTFGDWIKLPEEIGGGALICENLVLWLHEEGLSSNKMGFNAELTDYKFMCFNGHVKCVFTVTDRFSGDGMKVTFFDRDWNPLSFERHYPKSEKSIPKPYNLEKMIELAEKLSEGVPFVRVDFYESDGQIYFGEMTFYPGGGFEEFTPEQWDKTLGDLIDAPISAGGGRTAIDGITVFIRYARKPAETDLKDYKFYCFNGRPEFCQVISDRSKNETIDFYDMDWMHQGFTGLALPHKPFSKCEIPKPATFENMKKSAAILSKGIPFLRVDFYEVDGRMYFGELTFYPASGFGEFEPDYYNRALGDMVVLSKMG